MTARPVHVESSRDDRTAPSRARQSREWTPDGASVLVARDASALAEARRLRFRVYVHEQGKRPAGADWERGELVDALDPVSSVWLARDGDAPVGTLTRTMVDPAFDVTRLPAELELGRFPCSAQRPLSYSSRFAITPDHRGRWVLPALARHAYVHGRHTGAVFDFIATNAALVPLFERIGYLRYTASLVRAADVGTLVPMVLVGTDRAHLERVRSPCLAPALAFPTEPRYGAWLRASFPIVDAYYDAASVADVGRLALIRHDVPPIVAGELAADAFVHLVPAGCTLVDVGERLTCAFVALDGRISVRESSLGSDDAPTHAPDGVAFSTMTVRTATVATLLCLPGATIERAARRHPEHAERVRALLSDAC